jgi:hypothetical protein
MARVDPTGGLGYAQGDQFPPPDASYIAEAMGKVLEKDGTDDISGAVTVSGTVTLTGADSLAVPDYDRVNHAEGAVTLLASPTSVAWPANTTHLRVTPAVSADTGVLLLPAEASSSGNIVHLWRAGSTSRTITVKDSTDTNTLGVIPNAVDGAMSLICNGTAWRVFAWSGALTSLSH